MKNYGPLAVWVIIISCFLNPSRKQKDIFSLSSVCLMCAVSYIHVYHKYSHARIMKDLHSFRSHKKLFEHSLRRFFAPGVKHEPSKQVFGHCVRGTNLDVESKKA